MAQKTLPSPLAVELDPVVAENYARHLQTADPWYAHDYVPFEQGKNFKFLGGHDWDPSEVTLPRNVTDALEILLITKDNLAGYHREFVEHFVLELNWGHWIGRWTAEENLHAIALREYLVVTRDIDPAANETVRVEHVMKGYRASHYTQVETLVFMALYERAHAVFCRRLATQIDEPALRGLVEKIAEDEDRHEEFFANLVQAALAYIPGETVAAIARRAAELHAVGADIDAYHDKVAAVAKAGIFGPAELHAVIADRITGWGLADNPELSAFVTP